MPDQDAGLEFFKLGYEPARILIVAAKRALHEIRVAQHFLDLALGAVQALMDLGEQIPPDDPARHNRQHEEQRDGGIERMEFP